MTKGVEIKVVVIISLRNLTTVCEKFDQSPKISGWWTPARHVCTGMWCEKYESVEALHQDASECAWSFCKGK